MNATAITQAAAQGRYSATIEILRGQHAAIVALTDSRGEWSGAGRIDLPHGSDSDLYELGYIYASRSAAAKGGTLDRYSKHEEKPARFAPETCGYRRVPVLERRPSNALNAEIGQGADRCALKTPAHWGNVSSARWLASGGSILVLGACSRNCPATRIHFESARIRANMKLPDGRTCADCCHVNRCVAFGFTWTTRTECDFAPSRFALLAVSR